VSEFDGACALVTGAGSGIGRASALAFGRRGATVVACDLDLGAAEATCSLIADDGGSAHARQADVADEESVVALFADVEASIGPVVYAHNNAGIPGALGLIEDYDVAEWNRVVAVNLTSVFLCMKCELGSMARRGRGAIVNTASAAGVQASPEMPAYNATKHGVVGLSRSAAVDYARWGIRVNALCPGPTATPMIRAQSDAEGSLERFLAGTVPLGRMGEPHELGEAVAWLCSDAASFVTGTAFLVDGGQTAVCGSPPAA
jgi:NAD(P)-dependent dehydrogenase (short-subunit alcohol dehydrogenase family)